MILCFGSVIQYQEASAGWIYLFSESLYCLGHHIQVYLLPFNAKYIIANSSQVSLFNSEVYLVLQQNMRYR